MSHALSRSLDFNRKAPINPHNDPHYYSYKLVDEPPPPPPPAPSHSQYQYQNQQNYRVTVEEGDIEEVDLEDNDEIMMGSGNREDVVERLNRKIASLRKRNEKLDMQLYGNDSSNFSASQTLSSTGPADGMHTLYFFFLLLLRHNTGFSASQSHLLYFPML